MTTPSNTEQFTPINEAGEETTLTDDDEGLIKENYIKEVELLVEDTEYEKEYIKYYESLEVIEPESPCDVFYDIYLDSVEISTSVFEIVKEKTEKTFYYVGEKIVEGFMYVKDYVEDCIEYYFD